MLTTSLALSMSCCFWRSRSRCLSTSWRSFSARSFLSLVKHSSSPLYVSSEETIIESQSKIEYFGHNQTQSKSQYNIDISKAVFDFDHTLFYATADEADAYMFYRCFLGRPYGVTGGLIKCSWCFFFFFAAKSPSSLGRSPRNFATYRNLCQFYKSTPKIRGALPPDKLGPKTCKISVDFIQPSTLIANISGTVQDIQNRKVTLSRFENDSSHVLWKKTVNFGPLTTESWCEFGPIKMDIFGRLYSALRGCCALKFFTR